MKKLLVILVLVLVPLQFSWTAAGEYCQHEDGVAAAHFGHHTHHHTKFDKSEAKLAAKAGKLHSDCGACHATGLALLQSTDVEQALALPGKTLFPTSTDLYTSHIPDGPLKPNRPLPA